MLENIGEADDQVDQLYGVFLSSDKIAARKYASDSFLFETEHGEEAKKRLARQLVQAYAEEPMEHFLLPCFNLPSSLTTGQVRSFQPASVSVSCPSSITGRAAHGQTSRCPSQILSDIMNLIMKVMMKDVMSSISQKCVTVGVHGTNYMR